jgi:hypothetical protein
MNLIEAIKDLLSRPNYNEKSYFSFGKLISSSVTGIRRQSWENKRWEWSFGSKYLSIFEATWPTTEDFLADDWYVVESKRKSY